jgi:4-hydroxy-tetrahydrodipicolinate synthase
MKKFSMQGTFTALVTPFANNGEIDYDALKKLIDLQIEGGVEGIVVCSTTGESPTLTLKEKTALIIKSVEFAKNRVPIIVGTGTYETMLTRDMTVLAKEHGASAALIVAPYYVKPSQEGLFEHYKLIADAVDIPQILYNCPGRTGVNILPETQLKLAEACPNIIGVKEASGDLDQMMNIMAHAPKGFTLMSGDDSLALPAISLGAKGVISVVSNYAPKKFSDTIRLALKGDFASAAKSHYELLELMNLNFVESNPVPVKYAMSLVTGIEDMIRMPLQNLKEGNRKLMKKALKSAGLIK